MKIRFYAPLLISVGLALSSASAEARTSHIAIKKYSTDVSKRNKAHAKHSANKRASPNRANIKVSHTKPQPLPIIEADSVDDQTQATRISTTLYPLATSRAEQGAIKSLRDLRISIPHIESTRTQTVLSASKRRSSIYLAPTTSSESAPLTGTYGVIDTDIADAAHKAGLTDDLIEELTHVFAWDIDFSSNLHPGDQFAVLYKNSPDTGNGRIYAAQFLSRGKFLTALRYEGPDGQVSFYTPEGYSLHKTFLSAPLDFARVSSHFSTHRKHPVLNRIRAHKGVDYAARTGTPVKASGDGEVRFRGRQGGYGQMIVLKHGEHYETVYAHLSGFKRNLKEGDRVMQGEVIGYVGQTGLATGPHLHYEFRIDGVHQNPEKLAMSNPKHLDGTQLAAFKDQTQPLLDKLHQIKSRNLLVKLP